MSDWKNVQYKDGKLRTNNSGGASALSDLTDVDLTNLTDGQIIKWDATSSKWVNANESGGSSSHTYSTTEQVVGTWIDGKPIYELVMNPFIDGVLQTGYTYSSSELTNSPFKNANPESIIDYRLILKRSTDYVDIINAAKSDILQTNTIAIVPNLNGNIWLPPTQYEESTKTVYIIIQYTKITD